MDKKIKVLFFIYYLGSGGAGRTFLNILNNIDRDRFEVILVTCNRHGNYEKHLKDDVKFIKLKSKRLRNSIFPLSKVIRLERPDIVFSTIPNYNVIAILSKILSFTKTKIIVREAALLGGDRKTNIKLRIYGLFYRFATYIVSLSNGVKDNLVERYRLNKRKIRVIYNPIDLAYIESRLSESIPKKFEHLFSDDKKIIISAGRLVKEKDHETLLKAFSIVTEKLNARLIILGEGPLLDQLMDIRDKLKLKDVHFLGFQTNPFIFVERSDVFALTSKREGFGNVITEALAVNTPVVSTFSYPGVVEILFNGEYEYLIEVGDENAFAEALIEILSLSPEALNVLIKKGAERVKDFEVKKIVKEYENIFTEVVS